MSIGSQLKKARLNKGLTQGELAKIVGITKSAIGNYEISFSYPKEEILIRLMAALDVDANFIYSDYMATRPRTLTSEETELLDLFDVLPKDDKTQALRFMHYLVDTQPNIKKTEKGAV